MDMNSSMFLADADKAQVNPFGFPLMDFSQMASQQMAFNPFAAALGMPAFMGALPTLPGAPALNPFSLPAFFDLTMASAAMSLQQPTLSQTSLFDLPTLTPTSPTMSTYSTIGSPISSVEQSPVYGSPVESLVESPLPSLTSTPSSPSSVYPSFAVPSAVSSGSSASASGQTKRKKKRKPKPRMAELPQPEAQAKRDSNRESARKCRERKREREQAALGENEILKQEIAELKLKVQVLTGLLLEKDPVAAAPFAKRQRLE